MQLDRKWFIAERRGWHWLGTSPISSSLCRMSTLVVKCWTVVNVNVKREFI